ncbi:MAG: SDR family NAD(P)-dependent oxidoreductase [Phycisphaerae bacterium]
MSDAVTVITGASRGIGLATARRMAAGAGGLLLAARDETALRAAAESVAAIGARVETAALDVGTSDGARRLITTALARFGRVDFLVNNAGYAPVAPIESMTDGDFDRVFATNCGAVFHATRAAWPAFRAQGGGAIVNVSSVASVDPFAGFAAYGAAKAWVNLFTKATADEGRPYRIRAYAVAPGAVETAMLRGGFPDFPAEQTLDPDDVAAVVESCCRGALRHSSGQTIFVRR